METKTEKKPEKKLTHHEKRLLRLKAQGLSIAEMAKICRLTPGTTRVYFSQIYKKIGRAKVLNMLINEQALSDQ